MVTLSEVVASNERIAATFPDGLVAVFIGGTSGVGEYSLKAFARYVPKARAYIVGRSQDAADRIIAECKQLNADSKFEFIKADVSLLKNVDEVCRRIRSKETAINLLFESQGSMAFEATTSEGLPVSGSLAVHSRIRFIFNLLPLLQKANSLRRVVSVLAATCEGAIDTQNISGMGFPLLKWRNQTSAIETLLLEEAARRAPDVSFVHTLPGVVRSGIMRDARGLRMTIIIAISSLFRPFIETAPAESGERHVFVATSAMYAPGQVGPATGVPVDKRLSVADGSDGQQGSGMYSVNHKSDTAPSSVVSLLAQYRQDGTAQIVRDQIFADFKKITGTEVMA